MSGAAPPCDPAPTRDPVPMPPQPARTTGAFAALRVRDYRIYWTTGLVSNTGTAMQGVALDWFVLTRTHDGTAVGLTAGLQFAPVLLLGLWGGVLADRKDRRKLLIGAQVAYAVQSLILTVAVFTGHAPLWLVYLLAFGFGCAFTVENPARLSFVPELVGGPLIPNAAGLNILSLNVARLVGPAVAGVLVGAVGSGWVFGLNAASYLVVLGGLLRIRPRPGFVAAAPPPWAGSGTAGLRYVARRPEFLAVFGVFGVAATFAVNFPTTLTLLAGRVFHAGASGLGLMNAALAVGTVAGTLVAARRSRPRAARVVAAGVAFGLTEAVASVMPGYTEFLALLAATGFVLMILNAGVSAFVQREVDEAMRGRVMAVYTVISMGGTPLGAPLTGWVSQHVGTRAGFGAGPLVAAAAAVAIGLWLRRRTPAAAPGHPAAVPGRPAAAPSHPAAAPGHPATAPGHRQLPLVTSESRTTTDTPPPVPVALEEP